MPNTIYGGCDCPQCRNKRKRPLPPTDEELLELQRQQRIRKARERKAAELAELEKRKPAPIPPLRAVTPKHHIHHHKGAKNEK